jgi:hypothetical protein
MTDKDWLRLIDALEALGLYSHTSPQRLADVKAEAAKTRYLFGWEDTQRDYAADAEELAEGNVADFVRDVSPFLNREGVRIEALDQDFEIGGAYSVTVNGAVHEMYSEAECHTNDIWLLSTKRAFAMVNEWLAKSGSAERVFALYGGNDLRAIFLTPQMHEAIVASGLLAPSEIPVPPDDL